MIPTHFPTVLQDIKDKILANKEKYPSAYALVIDGETSVTRLNMAMLDDYFNKQLSTYQKDVI